MKTVVSFSGGMDSTVLLSMLLYRNMESVGRPDVMAVTFNYGSLHNEREKEAARQILKYFKEQSINIPWVTETTPSNWYTGVSALTGDIEMPEKSYEDIEETEVGPSPTVVPFRNAFLISRCTTNAIKFDYEYVAVATHASDHANWAYPDCSPEFLGAMANAIYVGSYHEVRLYFPFVFSLKTELVTLGAKVKAPLHLSYSCYKGGPMHCGTCPTCIERQLAFREAGYQDPTHYEVYPAFVKEGLPWPTK